MCFLEGSSKMSFKDSEKGSWKGERNFRKSAMSIKFPPVILGPEMAAQILWAPGIFGFFLLENPPCP